MPSLYGGAGSELFHQIKLWQQCSLPLHIIPTHPVEFDQKYLAHGCTFHAPNDWASIPSSSLVISFCNRDFLRNLAAIRQRAQYVIYVNCMAWLYPEEKEAMRHGFVDCFLYQNEKVMNTLVPQLRRLNPNPRIQFRTFVPYFDSSLFPFVDHRPSDFFCAGHISRQEPEKFAVDTWRIYESFSSPVAKKACFLGYDRRSRSKTGPPPEWVQTYLDEQDLSQQDFYRSCHVVLQPTDTVENWPRIGFEAMASGSVLIVDKRGGWEQMIEHGKTGWLCENAADFIAYASKMAWEPRCREDMAGAARERGSALGGLSASLESWKEVFYEASCLCG